MSAEAPLLQVSGLRAGFKKRTVLEGVDFHVAPGEIFGLLGPNGSGKSTTFLVLTGLLVPHTLTLRFEGQVVSPGARSLRRHTGVVFQSPSVDPNLSPREHLELARALVHRPRLLILDEPTVGLDQASFERTWERLEALRAREGLTLLLTTHRPEEAARCDRLALLDAGRIVATDTPARLQASVTGDIVTLTARDPETLAQWLKERFDLDARVVRDTVVLACERGHEWIPRIVEALPTGRLEAVNLQRPTLAEVFRQLTGRTFFSAENAP